MLSSETMSPSSWEYQFLLKSNPEHYSSGAIVNIALGAETPIGIIILLWSIYRHITLITVAHTAATARSPATVVVRDNVVFSIGWIATGAYPCHGRHFGSWWTAIR